VSQNKISQCKLVTSRTRSFKTEKDRDEFCQEKQISDPEVIDFENGFWWEKMTSDEENEGNKDEVRE
jgi:hypothetical protein